MTSERRAAALQRISENIARHGYHTYSVSGGDVPRFVYTIGLREKFGAELCVAGAGSLLLDDVLEALRAIISKLETSPRFEDPIPVAGLGVLGLRAMHPSWTEQLLLGAIDFYGTKELAAYQVLTDHAHSTIDVPTMSEPFDARRAPIWKWLVGGCLDPVLSGAKAVTNIRALRGERVTEVVRCDERTWEMFAGPGPEVTDEAMRVVPISTLLGADASLEAAIRLAVGDGLWRDEDEIAFHDWPMRSDA